MEASITADEFARQGLERHRVGELSAAEALYRRALAVEAENPLALHYLGLLSCQAGNLPPGLVLLQRSVELRPNNAHFLNNLGNAYRGANHLGKAASCYRQAARLDPKVSAYQANLGIVLWQQEQHDAALSHVRRALRLDKAMGEALLAEGCICKDLGCHDEALAALDRGIKHASGETLDLTCHAYLYALNFHPIYSPATIFEAHRTWAKEHADPLTPTLHVKSGDLDPERRLKVGYVSAYFRSHAVNFFMEPVLVNHDRKHFEIFCYSDVSAGDFVTRRLRNSVERWCHIVGLSDEELARQIRADGINILVDLSGHMGTTRLLAFARKPAPIQVAYLGYQATTGMEAMDYRLTDAYADPPGQTEAWHTEKLVRLPQAFFCYQPPEEAPSVIEPPGLKRKTVTFGSFNIFAKVTPQVLATWAKILQRVPGSRLQLLVPNSGSLRQRVLGLFANYKIAASRIIFVPRAGRREYLGRFQTVDIALDPFPFNSHTTSCDALWMGVPTVMLAGKSYVQRYGGTAMVNLGLADLIATTPEEYIETAVRWAADLARLAELRRSLREQMRTSVLCDTVGFTRRLEAAYQQMWKKHGELAGNRSP